MSRKFVKSLFSNHPLPAQNRPGHNQSSLDSALANWFSPPMRLHLLIAAGAVLCSSHATARSAASPASDVNLAVIATPTGSYVSGDTRDSTLNDGSSPRSSRGDRHGTYGNWPRQKTQ